MDAGAETSASFLQGFVLALLSYPDCQRKLQAEMDTVVGPDRLPSMSDSEALPYLRAFINEVRTTEALVLSNGC
jgi:cytochrome P450